MTGQIGQLMRQAQQELAGLEVVGEAGAGMVKVTMSCRHEVRGIAIDPELLGDDKEMLEDLVAAAVNDALRKVEQTVQDKYAGMTSGLGLPGGMKLPF